MPVRILIVDDHPLAREAIRVALAFCSIGSMEVVGEAADGESALELARCLLPDVITMDIGLPRMNGLEATRRITTELPHIKVIMVTLNADQEHREAAALAGAAGYVTKDNLLEGLQDCLARIVSRKVE